MWAGCVKWGRAASDRRFGGQQGRTVECRRVVLFKSKSVDLLANEADSLLGKLFDFGGPAQFLVAGTESRRRLIRGFIQLHSDFGPDTLNLNLINTL
jgi:hypothetical protein